VRLPPRHRLPDSAGQRRNLAIRMPPRREDRQAGCRLVATPRFRRSSWRAAAVLSSGHLSARGSPRRGDSFRRVSECHTRRSNTSGGGHTPLYRNVRPFPSFGTPATGKEGAAGGLVPTRREVEGAAGADLLGRGDDSRMVGVALAQRGQVPVLRRTSHRLQPAHGGAPCRVSQVPNGTDEAWPMRCSRSRSQGCAVG
jgi:hypothetical protein